jgi:hypothetical protein
MNDGIKKTIDYIRANSSYAKVAIERQTAVWRREKGAMPVLALSCGHTEEQHTWIQGSNTKDIHFDCEKMLANGLRDMVCAINGNYGSVPSMRANMGCGIIASLFGPQQELYEDKMPWLLTHLKKDEVKPRYDFKIGDSEEFAAAMRHIEYMRDFLREHGLTDVFVYPLDLQGPIDTAHLVYGDTIFYDFTDDPQFVHHLLEMSNDAIEFAMKECFKRIDRSDEFITHYNHLAIPREYGGLKVSEDTTTLLSPAHIDEFAQPHLRETLERFGGGYVHYCGKNNHLFDVLLKEPLAWSINFGNTEMHDMADILKRCRDNKKIYVGGIEKKSGESLFDYFVRILAPSYDRDTGCFYIIPDYWCSVNERETVIGEFERAAEAVRKGWKGKA